MLTPKQAAEKSGVSVSLVYQWCKEGLLEHLRLGGNGKRGKVLIPPAALNQFLEERRRPASIPAGLRHITL